jgi:hypothetical protein
VDELDMYDPVIHHRRSIRMAGHEYAEPGYYFVTICVKERVRAFGDVVCGRMAYCQTGHLAKREINRIDTHFKNVRIDSSIVMPDHIHITIQIKSPSVRARFIVPQLASPRPTVGARFIAPQDDGNVGKNRDAMNPGAVDWDVGDKNDNRGAVDWDVGGKRGAMNRGAVDWDVGGQRGAMNRAPTIGEIVRAYKARCHSCRVNFFSALK